MVLLGVADKMVPAAKNLRKQLLNVLDRVH